MQSDFSSDIVAVIAVVEFLLFSFSSCSLIGEVDVLKSSKESNKICFVTLVKLPVPPTPFIFPSIVLKKFFERNKQHVVLNVE